MELIRSFGLLACLMVCIGCAPTRASSETEGSLSTISKARLALNPQQGQGMFVDGTRPVPPGGAVEQVLQELRGKGYRIQPYDDRADLWVGVYAFSFDSSPGKGELVVEIQERYTHRRVWLGWIVLAPAGARRESGAFPVRTEDVKELLQSLPVL